MKVMCEFDFKITNVRDACLTLHRVATAYRRPDRQIIFPKPGVIWVQ